MRKQLDHRIPVLINNNVKQNHRSFIVLVGDKGRDQVCSLSYHLRAGQRQPSFFFLPTRFEIFITCYRKPEYLRGPQFCGATRRSWALRAIVRNERRKLKGMSNVE